MEDTGELAGLVEERRRIPITEETDSDDEPQATYFPTLPQAPQAPQPKPNSKTLNVVKKSVRNRKRFTTLQSRRKQYQRPIHTQRPGQKQQRGDVRSLLQKTRLPDTSKDQVSRLQILV